jgi:hypothetical protein
VVRKDYIDEDGTCECFAFTLIHCCIASAPHFLLSLLDSQVYCICTAQLRYVNSQVLNAFVQRYRYHKGRDAIMHIMSRLQRTMQHLRRSF